MDNIVLKELTDEEWLITFANELDRSVNNAKGHEPYIMLSLELASIISERVRDISEIVPRQVVSMKDIEQTRVYQDKTRG